MNFKNKTLWITGASFAIELSKKKCQLILSSRNKDSLDQVSKICKVNGSSTLVIPFDLGDENSVNHAANKVIDKNISIHGLYHFGGISQRSLVSETKLSIDRKIFEVNFFGTIALTKKILPILLKNKNAQIGVTTSIVGKFGFPYRSSYSATKHALHGFFESLRIENKKNGLIISFIVPGRIKTNISKNAIDKEGNSYNKMDPGQDKGKTTESTVKIIVNKLEKDKKEILVGGKEIIMVYVRRFFPSLYYYLSNKIKPF